MSALTILADAWNDADDDPYLAAERVPFGPRFPGLAPAETMHLPQARLEQAVSALPPAYLGLVAANRPADVPARVGWSVFTVAELGAVLVDAPIWTFWWD